MPLPTASRKRAASQREQDDELSPSAGEDGAQPPPGNATSTTNFRNVAACYRCRKRKNRCDQKLPRCLRCVKADAACIGFDPLTKRSIPRNYVYFLETRVRSLESLLLDHRIPVPEPSEDFPINPEIRPGENVPFPVQDDELATVPAESARPSTLKVESLAAGGTGTIPATPNPSQGHGSSTGTTIPFARVVYAAVKSSVAQTQTPPERSTGRSRRQMSSATASGGGTSQSFFSLHSRPVAKAAPFPEKAVGHALVELYFEHANPQIPILHRPEYMELFDRVYDKDPVTRTPREQYLLNIVFAIGAGIIVETPGPESMDSATDTGSEMEDQHSRKRTKLSRPPQQQPENYHAAAIVHLESFLSSSPAAGGVGGGLEELQAVLLLAGLALLRPIAPGLWYIIGLAMRLATDLGLHLEDADEKLDTQALHPILQQTSSTSAGRRQWTRDLRRRLWWCVYCFDRLVSTCVGRPCTVPEDLITTRLPSLLPDNFITPAGFLKPPGEVVLPSYKFVARHYTELRLLQSEILRMLQHRQSRRARELCDANSNDTAAYNGIRNAFAALPPPFTHNFDSFREWRTDVDRRLLEWKESAPTEDRIDVRFNPLFLELNYWQAVLLLYKQSLEVPEPLGGDTSLSPSTAQVHSPGHISPEEKQDEQIAMKIAQAGQRVLKIYKELHNEKLVNYTFLATHHIFMSGISFLSAIWHSALVRKHLTFDDVEFTIFVATSVLSGLAINCPPAEACKTALIRAKQATVAKVGRRSFGRASTLASQPLSSPGGHSSQRSPGGYFSQSIARPGADETSTSQDAESEEAPALMFDHDLRTLFSEDELPRRPLAARPKQSQPLDNVSSAPSHGTAMTSFPAQTPLYASSDSQIVTSTIQYAPPQPSQSFPDFQSYSAPSETLSQPSLDFENMDWFYPYNGSESQEQSLLPGSNELDPGFGTGNAIGLDDDADFWDAAVNPDLSGGLFFGNGAWPTWST